MAPERYGTVAKKLMHERAGKEDVNAGCTDAASGGSSNDLSLFFY